MTLLLGRKRGMTQVFKDDGTVVPVTVVEAGPCVVCQVKTVDSDGYDSVQLGFEDVPDARSTKPRRGHFAKANVTPKRFLREERLVAASDLAVGDVVNADVFSEGDIVDVTGTSKGRGFAGTVKRHGFQLGPKSHGSRNYRAPGSIGASAYPGRVWKGKRMAGHYGAARSTTKNLAIVRVDLARNLLFVKGSIPGPLNGFVQVRTARTGGGND